MERGNTFNVLKQSEGGITKKDVQYAARRLGIKVRFCYSPLIGHFGVEAITPTGLPLRNKRLLDRLGTIIL